MATRRVLAPNPGPFTLEGTNTWIVGDGPTLVIDPGPDDAEHLRAVRVAAGDVRAILLTHHHPDHAPGAAALSGTTGAPVLAFDPAPGESPLGDGATTSVPGATLTAVHTPGHTSDHLSFWNERSGELYTGDAVLGRGTSVIDPPEGDLTAYLASLRRLASLGPRVIRPGHGPDVEDAAGLLEGYLEHRAERERQVVLGLATEPRTPAELVPAIYAGYPAELHPVAARSVLAHLLKLEAEGRARRVGDRRHERFELVSDPPETA